MNLQTVKGFYSLFKANVAVVAKFRLYDMIERGKINKNAVSAGGFYGGNEIGIARYKNNSFGNMVVANPSEVKTDFNVNALLMKLRLKVVVGKRRFVVGGFSKLPSAKLERAFTDREKVKLFYVGKQLDSVRVLRSFFKKKGAVCDWRGCFCGTRGAVIKINAMKAVCGNIEFYKQLLGKLANVFRRDVFFLSRVEFFAQKRAVYKYRCVHNTLRGKKIDLLRVHWQKPVFYIKPCVRSLCFKYNMNPNICQEKIGKKHLPEAAL